MSLTAQREEEQAKRQESLTAAFAFFNQTSEQLAKSYKSLEARVQELSRELDHSETERVAENKKNIELEQRMRALLDFLPGGVVVLNARGVIIESNPAAKEFLASSLEGRLWRKVIADSFAPKNDDGLEVSTKSGRRLSISTSSLGDEGQIILLTDQTETRQLQEHLSRNQRLSAMGKMVSALAHQIRTPLSAAVLYAGHLCQTDLEPEVQQKFSQKCLGRLRHMEKQVRDMMLFVKSELPLNDVVTLSELEGELKAAAEVVIQSSDCECIWENLAPQTLLKCHREALVSSLMNLIINSTQAGSGTLSMKVIFDCVDSDKGDRVRISIQDNGCGMSPETLSRIQEIFTTTKSQGTGLGLAVVRSVAKAHGADFRLFSKQGKGTLAMLQLPSVSSDGLYATQDTAQAVDNV